MTAMAAGLVLVVIDLRFDRFDLLADPIGWLLVAEGCRRLVLRTPMWAALVAGALSASEVWLPHHHLLVDAGTGQPYQPGRGTGRASEQLVFGHVTGLQLVTMAAAVVVGGVAIWLLLSALARAAVDEGADARRLRAVRWTVLAWVVPFVVVAVAQHDGFDPVWNERMGLIALAGIVAVLAVALQLLAFVGRRWALPPPVPLRAL
ncbi:MAG: hypothetical protein JWN67_2663 [Actinomycetia bacterium]|nr:hypothetical protein [Actinomycetes bacterium]